jgi:F-type H+-transporting ATPase subunit delta
MSTGAGNAYAAAIHTMAVSEGALDVVESELAAVARAIASDRELQRQLGDRQLPVTNRLRLLETAAFAAAHPVTKAALAMLIGAERIGHLDEVSTALAEQSAADRDLTYAEVQVANPLTDAQTSALQAALERATGNRLTMRVVVDPNVIGGVRARIGDTVIDGSVARRIAQLRTRIGV